MNEDQIILPVPEGVSRPLWSVMIPVYNRTKYVSQAVESVLAQDPGPDKMQICVVDNSTESIDWTAILSPEALRRIDIFKQPVSVSGNENWNTCIRRSRGHLVHILHDDDWVTTEFYERMETQFDSYKDVAIVGSRWFVANPKGVIVSVSPLLENTINPPYISIQDYFRTNPFRCPGVVVRRSFYESNGGFSMERTWTIDFEMWARAIIIGSGILIDDVLAYYRCFEHRAHHDMKRTGALLIDHEECFNQLRSYSTEISESVTSGKLVELARVLEIEFTNNGDYEPARINRQFWLKRVGFWERFRLISKDYLRKIGTSLRPVNWK